MSVSSAPISARTFAMARPMPLLAPQTTARRPSRLSSMIRLPCDALILPGARRRQTGAALDAVAHCVIQAQRGQPPAPDTTGVEAEGAVVDDLAQRGPVAEHHAEPGG